MTKTAKNGLNFSWTLRFRVSWHVYGMRYGKFKMANEFLGLFYPYLKSVYIHFVEYVFLEFYTYFKMFEYVYLSIVNKVINYINRPFWLFGDRELDHLESWINLIQRRICKRIKKPFWVMIQWVRVRVNSPNQEEDETHKKLLDSYRFSHPNFQWMILT